MAREVGRFLDRRKSSHTWIYTYLALWNQALWDLSDKEAKRMMLPVTGIALWEEIF